MNNKLLAIIVTLVITFSCKKDSPQQPLRDLINSGGTWAVTDYYWNIGDFRDTSTRFAGTLLEFHTDGKIHVQGDNGETDGTWEAKSIDENVSLLIDLDGEEFEFVEAFWAVDTLTPSRLIL